MPLYNHRRKKIALLYLYYNSLLYNEKRWWIRPIFKLRKQQGDYHNLISEMRLTDEESYFNYMRMSPTLFEELLSIVGPSIKKQCVVREPISPGQRLAVTLRYLASGDSIASLSFNYRLGKTTVSNIIKETTETLWINLKNIVFKVPTVENWLTVANSYHCKWNFPNCIGAIDGKHISMQAPNNMGSEFYNYKGYHSIVLLGLCDANYLFIMVDIGASGSQSDSGVLKNSVFYKKLLKNSLNIPPNNCLPRCNVETPFVIVGDEAFPLMNNLMRPYPGRNTTVLLPDIRIYNYRLSRARRVIENTFGIMVSRWRILRKSIIGKTDTVINVTKAVTCLHNWLQEKNNNEKLENRNYCPTNYTDKENLNTGEVINGEWRNDPNNLLPGIGRAGSNMYTRNTNEIREKFKNYFMNEGSVPWQWNTCNLDMNEFVN